MNIRRKSLLLLALFSAAAFIIHIIPDKEFGLHRDEFLYLALGRHPAWGYWSNPPLIGWMGFLAAHIPFGIIFSTRIIPALAGALLVLMTGLTAAEFGGNLFAQALACVALITTTLFLRAYSMLMPVAFDILFWTLFLFTFLKYLNTRKPVWIYIMAITGGLGMLNKYMIGFLIAGLFLALLVSRHRSLLKNKHIWYAALAGFVIVLPNIIWQYNHHFPVVYHFKELADTQLSNVNRSDILIEQVLIYFGSSILWLAGLIWLLNIKKYRVFFLLFAIILTAVVYLRGKSYYTAGLYPFYIGAGATFFGHILNKPAGRWTIVLLVILLNIPLIPAGIPIGKKHFISAYLNGIYKVTGADAVLRWEDGKVHSLPQDYADRLGWEVPGNIVKTVRDTASRDVIVYCDNYGQAGAVEFFAGSDKVRVQCFSDSYLLWVKESVPEDAIYLYITGEPDENVRSLFERTELLGGINDSFSREYGTSVYLMERPLPQFFSFWTDTIRKNKQEAGQE
jgi:hypothetical protein